MELEDNRVLEDPALVYLTHRSWNEAGVFRILPAAESLQVWQFCIVLLGSISDLPKSCHTIANALIHLCCVVPACSNYWTLLPDPKVAPDPIRLTKHNISHNYLGPLDCCS
ncbi:hypothetical protein OPQ81_009834 [Rhizoctonia solani]|nr:hypothetical protein OPQ81_009834 [Rhizoctonia solani]